MPKYTFVGDGLDEFRRGYQPDESDMRRARARNNPRDEPTGDHTGRCRKCGSSDLWDDNLAYGCNACGAIYT